MSTGRFSCSLLRVFFQGAVASGFLWSAQPAYASLSAGVALESGRVTQDSLVVRAAGIGTLPLASGPATMTIIDLEDLAVGADLATVLESVAGLQIRRYGGLGSSSVPSLRGSGGAGLVIMIDGVPLADAQAGAIDLSTLPVDRFGSAEVYRGLTPAGFGSFGGAGAINLISRDIKSDDRTGSDLQISGGSFGEVGGRLINRRRFPLLETDISLMLHARRIDNAFEFLDRNQTFSEASDDRIRRRENAGWREKGAVLSGRSRAAFTDLDLRAAIYTREGGRPGPLGGFESPTVETRYLRRDIQFRAGDGRAPFQVDAYAGRIAESLIDENREIGGDPPGTTFSNSDQFYLRGIARREFDLPGGGFFSVWESGCGLRRQTFDLKYDYSLVDREWIDPTRVRRSLALFGSFALYSPEGGLSIISSLIWRRLDDDFPALPPLPHLPEIPLSEAHIIRSLSPSLSLSWAIRPGRWLMESHWSQAQREPTWVELFGHRGGVVGNRELQPEDLINVDLSLRHTRGQNLMARLGIFNNRAWDTIIWRRNSQLTSTATNGGASRTRGLELEFLGTMARRLRWWGNLTWQQARDRSIDYQGRKLPYLPDLDLAAGLSLRLGDWESGVRLSHESDSFRDRYNTAQDRIPARTILGLSLSRSLNGGTAFPASVLRLEILNLSDNRIYDIEGYPLPGRSFRLAMVFN